MKKISLARFKYTPYGGAENYLARVIQAMKEKRIPFLVFSTNWVDENAKKITVPKLLPSFLRILLFAYSVCKQKNKDEILFSLERLPCADVYRAGDGVHKGWLDVRLKSGESRLKIFLNPLQLTYLWLERLTFKNAKKIIANSYFVKNDIIKHYGVSPNKIEVVYNGVLQNRQDEQASKESICVEFGLNSDKKIILFAGSGFARKGGLEFLEILSSLKRDDYTAIMVGKEKKIGFYRNFTQKHGLNVIFAGARKDIDRFYAAADIFLFPTRYEPFSNVCLEAMSGGCAVITTAQNGASEILEDRFVMKTPKDINILPTIHKLLDDNDFLSATKEWNKAKSVEFSVERNLAQTLTVLDGL